MASLNFQPALNAIRELEKSLESEENVILRWEHKFVPALFYCDWLPEKTKKDKKIKQEVQSCEPWCCFNHLVGLPRLVYEDPETKIQSLSEPIPLNDYEKEWIEAVQKYHYLSIVAFRGSGKSEILPIRWKLFKAITNTIPGRKFLVIAGTRLSLALELMIRLKQLADRIPFVYKERPTSDFPREIKIGLSRIKAYPASIDAIRGEENVEDIDGDEQTAWDLIEDKNFLDALEPLVAKSGAYIRLFGTPKGQKGFMWTEIWKDGIESKYHKIKTTVEDGLRVKHPLVDPLEVERMKVQDADRYAQEMMCEFLLPSDSYFGSVEDEDREDYDIW